MTSSDSPTRPPIGATVLGYPRIGRNRELKRALEAYWAGRCDTAELESVAAGVRADALTAMNGLDSVPVNTFSYYDHVLDTAVLVDAVPDRFGAHSGDTGADLDTYFAMARGDRDIAPLEMTKWFDTNYHYLVPEIAASTVFTLRPDKPLREFREATDRGLNARPVVIGPWTFLRLAKRAPDAAHGFDPMDRLDDLVGVYAELLAVLADAGVAWVQIDEPAAVADLTDVDLERLRRTYDRLSAIRHRPGICIATYFASADEALPVLAGTAVEAIGVDVLAGVTASDIAATRGFEDKTLVLGAVDGRNIWASPLRDRLVSLVPFLGLAGDIAISSSCSLLHVPYDASVETDLDPRLRECLAFADQKLAEVTTLRRALREGTDAVNAELGSADRVRKMRRDLPGVDDEAVRERTAALDDAQRRRDDRHRRRSAQAERLSLPALPTTTIGSFPQTAEVRRSRAERRAGTLDEQSYAQRMRAEIDSVIALQERVGLDVLVHGEPERNDMVQYFAEQLAGFASTAQGWVQSYGSRCVRPPILYGDVSRPEPMTVEWTTYAQSRTALPVKGMLTGPVTMLAWSFVRDDQPLSDSADQIALALRDEVTDLETAGIGIIQVDEPALRELLPLRAVDRPAYLGWAVDAFRLATAGAAAATQIHTHLCYSEFGEIIDAIDRLDADVTSIEAARSHMELLADLAAHGFGGALGPGVYDIHSPRVPETAEVRDLIDAALRTLPVEQMWVNPDCGLKTRGYAEIESALTHLVEAARERRVALGR